MVKFSLVLIANNYQKHIKCLFLEMTISYVGQTLGMCVAG